MTRWRQIRFLPAYSTTSSARASSAGESVSPGRFSSPLSGAAAHAKKAARLRGPLARRSMSVS
jgi:hypothetical protein